MPRRTVADHRPNTRRRRSTQDVSVFSGVHIGRMLRCSELTGGVYHNRITSFSCCKVTESPRCSCRHPFLRKHSWHLVCLIVYFPCFLRLLYSSIAGLCPISRKLSKTQWKTHIDARVSPRRKGSKCRKPWGCPYLDSTSSDCSDCSESVNLPTVLQSSFS